MRDSKQALMSDRGKNYRAWQVRVADYPHQASLREQLTFLVRYALLSPSSHNSQPWSFDVTESSVVLHKNAKRHLPVADPQGRLIHFGLGSALEHLLIAADYFNFDASVSLISDTSDEAAKVVFQKKSGQTLSPDDHLIHSIPRRRTNRNKYQTKLPPDDFISLVKSLSGSSESVAIVLEEKSRHALADVVLDFRDRIFGSAAFRAELALYKKTNVTRSRLGMPGFTLGFPLLVSLIAPVLIRFMNIPKRLRPRDEAVLKQSTPLFIVLGSAADDEAAWMRIGRLFARITLEAEKRGLSTAVSSLPQGVEERDRLKDLLGLQHRPQFAFRVGYADGGVPGHSPRLDLGDVIL